MPYKMLPAVVYGRRGCFYDRTSKPKEKPLLVCMQTIIASKLNLGMLI